MQSSAPPPPFFKPELAVPRFPRAILKYAILVPVQADFPTFIQPEWDDTGLKPQKFVGQYYLVIGPDGKGRYGSAKVHWENMHRPVPLTQIITGMPGIAWVKVKIPVGHHTDRDEVMFTTVWDEEAGGMRESRMDIKAGTLVLQQPGGEYQFVRPEDELATYYTPAEAGHFGLYELTADEFASWAVAQATKQFVNG